MRDIGGVLITHEHSDHISGLKMLIKYYRVPVYAPRTVAASETVLFVLAIPRHLLPLTVRTEPTARWIYAKSHAPSLR